jgi:hypothetical protein
MDARRRGYVQHRLYVEVRGLTVKLDKSKSSRFTIRSKFDTACQCLSFEFYFEDVGCKRAKVA